ncbi:uncharacterized protein BDZ99DRAFT_394619 [Mytilinidion resinicola]|uniref:Major facilitator superfamily (MFS) profile domain-containing protein n=1 Tax=Mytilinidion resinicola TaxID=574789 RepID=A0A6A6YBG3_9PEZI|nr:uncharacterized protein BDZ99DRAFT_394619 [Mytilinidion resinicola]KAF2806152.1 hypothetical protein BDZ99DRAFT_394619 [Mytilinidion resinicola]
MGTFRWILTCSALYSATLLYGLDTTIVADVQVPIVEKFGQIEKMTWIGAAFPLGSVAIILPLGVMYESFDSKWLYIMSFALFETGSALCGASPNMNALIIGRVIAGIGGSGLYLGNLNIFASLTAIQERPMYVAGAGLCWGVGAILGPVIGGAFAKSSATWRWVRTTTDISFYINLVVAAFSGPTYLFSLPSIPARPGVSTLKKISEVDILGTTLFAGIFAMFIIPLTLAEGSWAWGAASTIICLALCGVLTATFIVQQAFSILTTPERRIFPVGLLYSRTMILLFISTSATSTNLFIPVYYIPIYFQFTRGDEPIQAAVRLLPFVLVGVFTTMLSGGIMPKSGFYMPWYVLSGVMGTTGGALMYTVKSSTSVATAYGYSILIAIGAGGCLQLGYSIAQAINPVSKHPSAIRFINMAQLGGTTIALTIAGRLFQTYAFKNVKNAVAGLGFTDAQVSAAVSGAQGTLFDSLTPQVRAAVLEGIVKAISKAYVLVIAGGSTTLICSFFMKREKLFQNKVSPVEEILEQKE